MIFQFQVGVTICYIIWRCAVPISKPVDRAIRDCTSLLAIFADRSQNAEVYHDCMDVLASSISRAAPLGTIDRDSRRELGVLVKEIEDVGLAPHIMGKLAEMYTSEDFAPGTGFVS